MDRKLPAGKTAHSVTVPKKEYQHEQFPTVIPLFLSLCLSQEKRHLAKPHAVVFRPNGSLHHTSLLTWCLHTLREPGERSGKEPPESSREVWRGVTECWNQGETRTVLGPGLKADLSKPPSPADAT